MKHFLKLVNVFTEKEISPLEFLVVAGHLSGKTP